jgi:hypothetical protein
LALSGCVSFELANNGAFTHRAMIFVPGVDKEELYKRSMIYLAKAYFSSSDVIQYASEEHGRIIGRGVASVTANDGFGMVGGSYSYSIDMEIVDGKIRVYFDDFYHITEFGPVAAQYQYEAVGVKDRVDEMIMEMNAAIKATPALLIPD